MRAVDAVPVRGEFGGGVAVATVAGADMILSWSFRHIVNRERIRKYNAVNRLNGYRQVDICSPLGIVYGGEDEGV